MIDAAAALLSAKKKGFAIGHFNIFNLETFQAVVSASKKMNCSVFMGVSNKSIDYAGLSNLFALYNSLPKNNKAILHLDHGSFVNAKRCVKIGFPSVMFDGSGLKLDKNISMTKRIVALGRKKGVCVEGEVGTLDADGLTSPDDAKIFADKTGVDALAVSIGNRHGFYSSMPVLDFKRLNMISSVVKAPLVLHGGTGLSETDYALAIKNGVSKINIDTELRWAFTGAVYSFLNENVPSRSNKESFDARNYLGAGRDSFEDKVSEFVRLFQK